MAESLCTGAKEAQNAPKSISAHASRFWVDVACRKPISRIGHCADIAETHAIKYLHRCPSGIDPNENHLLPRSKLPVQLIPTTSKRKLDVGHEACLAADQWSQRWFLDQHQVSFPVTTTSTFREPFAALPAESKRVCELNMDDLDSTLTLLKKLNDE